MQTLWRPCSIMALNNFLPTISYILTASPILSISCLYREPNRRREIYALHSHTLASSQLRRLLSFLQRCDGVRGQMGRGGHRIRRLAVEGRWGALALSA